MRPPLWTLSAHSLSAYADESRTHGRLGSEAPDIVAVVYCGITATKQPHITSLGHLRQTTR